MRTALFLFSVAVLSPAMAESSAKEPKPDPKECKEAVVDGLVNVGASFVGTAATCTTTKNLVACGVAAAATVAVGTKAAHDAAEACIRPEKPAKEPSGGGSSSSSGQTPRSSLKLLKGP